MVYWGRIGLIPGIYCLRVGFVDGAYVEVHSFGDLVLLKVFGNCFS